MKRVFAAVITLVLLAGCLPVISSGPTVGPAAPPPDESTPLPPPLAGPIVEEPQFASFHMLNETDGWGVTETAVVRTNDGGTTWHNVSPPGDRALGFPAGSAFPDAFHAFVVAPDPPDMMHAGTLYRTDDGGQTWTSNAVPFGYCQLQFFEDGAGWAMVSLGVGAGSNAIAIFQTTDGGVTWNQRFINDPTVPGSSDEIPLGGLKGSFAALDMQNAWLGGVIYSPATVYLYRTRDGGRRWEQVPLEAPAGSENAEFSVEDIQFFNPRQGFLSMRIAGETMRRAIFSTRDSGNTWALAQAVIPDGRSTDFVSAEEGFVYDGRGFHFTRDAGVSWQQVEPDIVFSESFIRMDFVNPMTGWVLASDPTTFRIGVYKTTDGGRTWLPQ